MDAAKEKTTTATNVRLSCDMKQGWQELQSPIPASRAWANPRKKMVVIVTQDPCGPGGELRWHLSMSCRDRLPSFEELRDARYEFLPEDVTMAMLFPPKEEYVNLHQNCLHLFEFIANEIITKINNDTKI